MQVTIETTEALERKMTVQLPVEDFQQEVQKRLQDTARRARLPGFRPGRVPLKEIQRRFGPGVRQEVAGELMQRTVFQAMAEQSLRPAGQPSLEWVSENDDSQFAYAATFEVFPEVALGDLSGATVETPEAEVTEADIDTMIERLREQRKAFVWKRAGQPRTATRSPSTSPVILVTRPSRAAPQKTPKLCLAAVA
jgi:trigger factor